MKKNSKNENEKPDNRVEFLRSNDDNIVFVPPENIRAIERVIEKWEAVKQLIIEN